MKHKLHIAYCNREDLTREAIASVRDIGNIHVWPNNGAKFLDGLVDIQHRVIAQHVLPDMSPISVLNMMIQSSWDDDVMFWAHNDCFAHPGAAASFFKATEDLYAADQSWGVHFSLYDVLCAFNMRAVRAVGYWDPMFFQYTADNDYYHRLRHAGYREAQWAEGRTGRTIEHRGSMTVRSDKLFSHRTQWRERTRFDKLYYQMKWGGLVGQEKFQKPFEDLDRQQQQQYSQQQRALAASAGGRA